MWFSRGGLISLPNSLEVLPNMASEKSQISLPKSSRLPGCSYFFYIKEHCQSLSKNQVIFLISFKTLRGG
jgi:hypothetical protein